MAIGTNLVQGKIDRFFKLPFSRTNLNLVSEFAPSIKGLEEDFGKEVKGPQNQGFCFRSVVPNDNDSCKLPDPVLERDQPKANPGSAPEPGRCSGLEDEEEQGHPDLHGRNRAVSGKCILTYQRRPAQKRKASDSLSSDHIYKEGDCLYWDSSEQTNEDECLTKMKNQTITHVNKFPEHTPSLDTVFSTKVIKSLIGLKGAKAPRHGLKQYFLDVGQADFSYKTCPVCGLMYAPGEENDEKVHMTFHRSHIQGIQFKGWLNERVAAKLDPKGSRIIFVLPNDPAKHQRKVTKVAAVMEYEMGLSPGWLVNEKCKVYMYICSRKVVGCVVVEPIVQGFYVIHCGKSSLSNPQGTPQTNKSTMTFGNAKFVREFFHKLSYRRQEATLDLGRAVMCDDTPVSARCGIRGIWVSSSERRRGIASTLLDTIRKSFCMGSILQPSQCAFSQPTPDGIAFASTYCKTDRFLVYR